MMQKLSIKKVEQFIKEDQDIFYKGLLWYSYARIFLAEGEYNLALENANKLVKSQENFTARSIYYTWSYTKSRDFN